MEQKQSGPATREAVGEAGKQKQLPDAAIIRFPSHKFTRPTFGCTCRQGMPLCPTCSAWDLIGRNIEATASLLEGLNR